MGKDVAHAPRTRDLRVHCCGVHRRLSAASPPRRAACSPDEARKRLESDRSRLEATERRSKELQADLDKIAAERERINARLVETAKLVQQSEGQLSLIESRLGELDAQEKHLRETLEARHGSISALLGAMLRMGRNPPPVMVASRQGRALRVPQRHAADAGAARARRRGQGAVRAARATSCAS